MDHSASKWNIDSEILSGGAAVAQVLQWWLADHYHRHWQQSSRHQFYVRRIIMCHHVIVTYFINILNLHSVGIERQKLWWQILLIAWAGTVTFSKVLTVHLPLMEIKTHFSSSFWLKFFLEARGAERFNTGRRKEAGAARWRTKNKCITLWQSWPG